MSEMIERVARAVNSKHVCDFCRDPLPADCCCYDAALAAIEAMREPTEAMMAAVACAGEKREWLSGQAWLAGWRAMIDEALR